MEEGVVDRIRPKLMTVFATILGLTPAMIGTGPGAEITQRIAAPMVGGLVTSTFHTLVMIPALYAVVQGRRLRRQLRATPPGDGLATDDLALESKEPTARLHDAPPHAMTTPLRAVVVVAALLASGFTAEHLASSDRPVRLRQRPCPSSHPQTGGPASGARGLARARPPSPDGARPGTRQLAVRAARPPCLRAHPLPPWCRPRGPGRHSRLDRRAGYRPLGRSPARYGLVVEIDQTQGIGRGRLGPPVRTRYAHFAFVDSSLRPGSSGVALGASGGRPGLDDVSTGAHLHLEVRDASGQSLDPAPFVRLSGTASGALQWTASRTPVQVSGDPEPQPVRSTSRFPDATGVTNPDTLAPLEFDLPEIVLPDYPSLPAITGTSPLPPLP